MWVHFSVFLFQSVMGWCDWTSIFKDIQSLIVRNKIMNWKHPVFVSFTGMFFFQIKSINAHVGPTNKQSYVQVLWEYYLKWTTDSNKGVYLSAVESIATYSRCGALKAKVCFRGSFIVFSSIYIKKTLISYFWLLVINETKLHANFLTAKCSQKEDLWDLAVRSHVFCCCSIMLGNTCKRDMTHIKLQWSKTYTDSTQGNSLLPHCGNSLFWTIKYGQEGFSFLPSNDKNPQTAVPSCFCVVTAVGKSNTPLFYMDLFVMLEQKGKITLERWLKHSNM